MTKLAKQTAARLVVTLAILTGIGIVASEYLSRNPPEPNTFLGQMWKIASR